MILNKKTITTSVLFGLLSLGAQAAGKTYTEEDFLRTFSGKSNNAIVQALGEPNKKEMSVKPSGANAMLAGKGKESSKPVNVEMWYYTGRVNYAPNKTYKFTELTFVNGRCMNIAFFNNK
jgi:hypothetical protein